MTPTAPTPSQEEHHAERRGAGELDGDLGGERDRSAQAAAVNNRAMLRALGLAIVTGVVLDVLVIAAAAIAGGEGAVPGALTGTGLALVVTLPTLLSARIGTRHGPAAMAGVVLGTWLGKMVVLIGVLLWVRTLSGVSLPWIGVALLVGAVAPAVVEALLLLRARPRLEVR